MPLSHAPFRTTHWSAILGAQCAPAPEAATALARLCEAFWYPIYASRLPATVPIDFGDAEERFAFEPSHHITPDRLFELRWAAALLDQAAARLRREAESDGRPERFAALLPYLTKETSPGSFADVAACLGLSEAAARQEVSRLRKCFREAIRDEIAEVVSGPEEIEDELRHLLNVFSA